MKAIIFGINGQDGYYLSELCRNNNIEVIGVSRNFDIMGWGTRIQGDVSDVALVSQLIAEHCPDYVFHLAAKSTTRHDSLFDNHAAISTGTMNILETVYRHSLPTKVFITGSGVQFVNNGKPIGEDSDFAPLSPYAVARIHAVYLARYYRLMGVKVYVGYLFHHESPLRKPEHVSQMIAQAVQRISLGSQEKITLGNVDVRKEWTYAGDVAEAMLTLVNQERVFEATIGSGITYSIADWLECCFSLIGERWSEHVIIKENFTPEYQCLFSSPDTIKRLGWTPQVDIKELARLMVYNIL